MKEAVAIAKEADAKKDFSPMKSDNSVHRVQHEPERQLGSLRGVINNIKRDGSTPSVDSIATELSSMPYAQRAPVLLALQQTHGNRYVQRVVAGIQAKLKVGQPGDIYEQEADRVADAVMLMPEPQVERQVEEEGEEILQTKDVPDLTPGGTPELESRIHALKGSGQPLPESARTYFEPRFGYDFSQVRIHTDGGAAETARAVNAQAFTVGQDIAFGAGQYAPETVEGKRLLAHELTHVVQQGRASSPEKIDGLLIDDTDSKYELEANEIASDVALGVKQPSKRPSYVDWAVIQRFLPAAAVPAVVKVLGVIGSVASVAGFIDSQMTGGLAIEEVRWPGIAVFPDDILTDLWGAEGKRFRAYFNKEERLSAFTLAKESRTAFEDLNIIMWPWLEVTQGGPGQPFTYNMGIRLWKGSTASDSDEGTVKIIRESDINYEYTHKDRKLKFAAKRVLYRAEIDEVLVGHWRQEFTFELTPYWIFPYFGPMVVKFDKSERERL